MADHRASLRVGNYKLIRLLGKGGFAEVYLGQHVHLNTLAAIKLLLKTQLGAAEIEKFRREARIVAALRHPHIVSVLDFGAEPDEPPYLVLDYAPNGSLRQRHPPGSVLSPTKALHYLRQVGEALDFAHNRGIIHRDIKPDNMLLGQRGEVLLSDFGIATVAASSSLDLRTAPYMEGTLPYMAPEQMQNKPQRASDQYALAIVAYEWLCGRRPFDGMLPEIVAGQLNTPPPPPRSLNPAIPAELETVILKALSKHPAQRYPSVRDFVLHCEQAITPSRKDQFISSDPDNRRDRFIAFDPAASDPRQDNVTTVAAARANLSPTHSNTTPDTMPAISHSQPVMQPTTDQQFRLRKSTSRRNFLLGIGATSLLALGAAYAIKQGLHPLSSSSSSHSMTISKNHPTSNTGKTVAPTHTAIEIGTTIYTYYGHTKNVLAVAWSPKDNLIASGGLDRIIQVWHAFTGSEVYSYGGHLDQINAIAWSPDGSSFASGSKDKTVHIVNTSTGNLVKTYSNHQDAVNSVAWSPDGTLIASASNDKTVQVWNATTGDLIRTYTGHQDVVSAVAWSPDGTFVASASSDKTVHVWKPSTGELLEKYQKHTDFVSSVVWSIDGQHIASGSDDHTVRVWTALEGIDLFIYQNHKGAVFTVACSSDGTRIASGSSDSTVQIWNFSTSNLIYTYSQHRDSVNSVAWSPDGKQIVSGGADRSVQVWQAA
jgi:WD40 repeat protein